MSRLQTALRDAIARLREAGVDSPEHDARALAVYVLGLAKPADLLMVDDIDETGYGDLVARRVSRVPLQHLTGTVGFRYLDLEVGPGVFVPRPETESVVQWAVDALKSAAVKGLEAPLLVDLCTGSGAIAFALANEVPNATVHAVERDSAALEWTRRNAQNRLKAGDPEVRLHLGAAEEALRQLDGTVDLVASNPPYISEDDRHRIDPEVIDHDPDIALFAGADGLDVVRLVEQAARRLLKPGGLVVVEHSDRQGESAVTVFAVAGGWTDIADHSDLTGRDRFVTARREGDHREGERVCG